MLKLEPFVIETNQAKDGNAPHFTDVKDKIDKLAADGWDYLVCLPEQGGVWVAVLALKEGETKRGVRYDQKIISISHRREAT